MHISRVCFILFRLLLKERDLILTVGPLIEPEKNAFQGWYSRPRMYLFTKLAAFVTVSMTSTGVPAKKKIKSIEK